LSEKRMVKYHDKDYLAILDGFIYEFENQLYTNEILPLIVKQFASNQKRTLHSINGEFVLILLHLSTSTCWVINSESGNAAFFYRKIDNRIYFSNSLPEILSTGGKAEEIHLQRIYDILTGNQLGLAHTCFKQVERLLPGHYMKVDKGHMSINKYSELFSEPIIRKASDDPYEHFRQLFKRAVKYRLDFERTGIALSSGKDSTSVAAMAYTQLGDSDKKLLGYTYRPLQRSTRLISDHRFNETLLLKSFYEEYPRLESRIVEPEKETIVSSLERTIEIFGEPVYGASNQYWIQAMHGMMMEDQCGAMLTGQGGNFTISWPPPELSGRASHSFRSFVKRMIPFSKSREGLPYVSARFLDSVNQEHFIEGQQRQNLDFMQPILMENSISYTGYLQKQVSLYHGFHISDPTVDKSIIQYCLSLPYEFYHDERDSRKLVTVGLKKLLPVDIRDNRIRSIQAADIQYRIQMEKDLILEKLQFLKKKNLVTFVIEIDKLERDFRSMDVMSLSRREVNHFLRLLLVGIFLSKI